VLNGFANTIKNDYLINVSFLCTHNIDSNVHINIKKYLLVGRNRFDGLAIDKIYAC